MNHILSDRNILNPPPPYHLSITITTTINLFHLSLFREKQKLLSSLILAFFFCTFNFPSVSTQTLNLTKAASPPLPYFIPTQNLPQYALDYAPLVYLHSDEFFWPAQIHEHLENVQPEINFTLSDGGLSTPDYLSSSQLKKLDPSVEEITYLTSKEPIFEIDESSWLRGVGPPDQNGKSDSPVIIIAVDKTLQVGPGWVDVFYLFFYSYNRGNYFYNNRFGDHVADWENTMIRFHDGKPVFISPEAHGGQVMLGNSAFYFNVLEEVNGRPIVYSANGTHGMYPQQGQQNYTGLPLPVYDVTDKGHLWDPTLNYKTYFYSNEQGFSYTANTPVEQQDSERLGWLNFQGYWGDQKYGLNNPHQTCIGEMCFFDSGPLGPLSKSLGRGWICGSSNCEPQSSLPTIPRPGAQRYNSRFNESNHLKPLSIIIITLGVFFSNFYTSLPSIL